MAIEATRTTIPTRRQIQVRVAALTFIVFTAACLLNAVFARSLTASSPHSSPSTQAASSPSGSHPTTLTTGH
jgi:hypothetical protein